MTRGCFGAVHLAAARPCALLTYGLFECRFVLGVMSGVGVFQTILQSDGNVVGPP